MGAAINISGLSLGHKGSAGAAAATLPDVRKTPSPGGPVPIPHPNVARVSALKGGTKTVKADGKMAAIHGSKLSSSAGDAAGTVGGVKSSIFGKEATWMLYSFDVKIEGENACRLTVSPATRGRPDWGQGRGRRSWGAGGAEDPRWGLRPVGAGPPGSSAGTRFGVAGLGAAARSRRARRVCMQVVTCPKRHVQWKDSAKSSGRWAGVGRVEFVYRRRWWIRLGHVAVRSRCRAPRGWGC